MGGKSHIWNNIDEYSKNWNLLYQTDGEELTNYLKRSLKVLMEKERERDWESNVWRPRKWVNTVLQLVISSQAVSPNLYLDGGRVRKGVLMGPKGWICQETLWS